MYKQNWLYNNPVDPEIYKSRTHWPKISIITPSYNQGQYIEETILSILNQNYPNLEYIIIDGGSTDNTIEVIKKYEDSITYWVSEKDNGQADAINKGLKKCTGEIFNWINSDDLLGREALCRIALGYIDSEHAGVLACQCLNFESGSYQYLSTNYNTNIDLHSLLNYKDDFHQPGLWIRTELIKQFNLDKEYHYSFDRIWLIKLFDTTKITIYEINHIVGIFRIHPSSKTQSSWLKAEQELLKFLSTYKFATLSAKKPQKRLIDILYIQTKTKELVIEKDLSRMETIKLAFKLLFSDPRFLTSRFFWGAIKAKVLK